jgi:hypothetical protein
MGVGPTSGTADLAAPAAPGSGGPSNPATSPTSTIDSDPRSCEPAAGDIPMRRLSSHEYVNTVSDLFQGMDLKLPPMPPDERNGGFDNNARALGPSPLLVEHYHRTSRNLAEQVAPQLMQRLPCSPSEGKGCGRKFIEQVGAEIFRRPLSPQQVDRFDDFFDIFTSEPDFQKALQLTVQAMLSSPQFLYHVEQGGQLSQFEVANRLSYLLWQSMPDKELRNAATAGELNTPERIEAAIQRMLADPRARDGFFHFVRQWFDVERLEATNKLEHDQFDDDLRHAMVEETKRFVQSIIWDDGGSLTDLLTSKETVVNERLAKLYDLPAVGSGWNRVTLSGQPRAGLLTQTAFLTGHGHPLNPSPVLRGMFILERLACAKVPSPPPGVDVTPPEIAADATNREAYTAKTQTNGSCASCHALINPVGFPFENFDTMGRYRDLDNGKPVDASGNLLGTEVNGPTEIAQALARHNDVAHCVSEQLAKYAFSGSSFASDPCYVAKLTEAFRQENFDFKRVLFRIATDANFYTVKQ